MRVAIPLLFLTVTAGCQSDPSTSAPTEATMALAATPAMHYDVVRLPSLGGAFNRASAINNRGWVAGVSQRTDGSRRAVLWPDHASVVSLETLGGPHSAVTWPGLSHSGIVVGISHSGDADPWNETWSCERTGSLPATADPHLACRGFWWDKGVLRPLPTLGGTHAVATTVNERGQAVGWAETGIEDPTCTGDQRSGFHAALWDLRRGTVTALRPYPGDSASAAVGINARGQVVGLSGDCDQAVGRLSARRAVLWDGDQVVELPNLGGTSWHTPWAINARGDVVGFGNPAGTDDGFHGRAFYWRHGSPTVDSLQPLAGHQFSQANGINASGLIVGVSHGGAPVRGVLWVRDPDGTWTTIDLTERMTLLDDEVFENAHDLNDAGQIAGVIFNSATLVRTAVVLTPAGH